MKSFVIALAVLAAPDDVAKGIRERCAREWPSDYEMQEYCIGQQSEAVAALRPVVASPDRIDKEILRHCGSEWGDDWQMLAYCYGEQRAAYDRLHPDEPEREPAVVQPPAPAPQRPAITQPAPSITEPAPAITPPVDILIAPPPEAMKPAPKPTTYHGALKAHYDRLMGRCGAELGGNESDFPAGFCSRLFTVEGLRSFCSVMGEFDWLGQHEFEPATACTELPERGL